MTQRAWVVNSVFALLVLATTAHAQSNKCELMGKTFWSEKEVPCCRSNEIVGPMNVRFLNDADSDTLPRAMWHAGGDFAHTLRYICTGGFIQAFEEREAVTPKGEKIMLHVLTAEGYYNPATKTLKWGSDSSRGLEDYYEADNPKKNGNTPEKSGDKAP